MYKSIIRVLIVLLKYYKCMYIKSIIILCYRPQRLRQGGDKPTNHDVSVVYIQTFSFKQP
jgi:hypothetical protein